MDRFEEMKNPEWNAKNLN